MLTKELMARKDISPSVASVHEATMFHGVNGIWSDDCGLARDIFTTYVQPYGILQYLPAFPTQFDLIRVGAITGFEPDSEDEPDGYCDDGPTGLYSTCRIDFTLGRIKRSAKTQAYTDTILRTDRGDQDFLLRGNTSYGQSLGSLGNRLFNSTSPQALNYPSELQRAAIANNLALTLGEMVWEGDPTAPAPANTPGGGKKSFWGFNHLIRTGYVDAVGEELCPTMDSQVYDFDFGDVCEGEVIINGRTFNLISLMQAAALRNEMLARDSYLTPLVGVIVMPEGLWQQVTECYACQYNLSALCSTNQSFNDGFTVRERDAMREGMYIKLNGKIYVVVTDNGMPVLDEVADPDNLDAGERAADIFYIPLSVMGMAVTYLRYLDFRLGLPNLNVIADWGDPRAMFTWTDDGKYLLTRQWVEECWKFSAAIMPGLVLRTPQFAWRINNVKWTDAIPFRNPYPDSPDFVIDAPLI